MSISYAVFCLKKKNHPRQPEDRAPRHRCCLLPGARLVGCFVCGCGSRRALLSFPTRRSSDLVPQNGRGGRPQRSVGQGTIDWAKTFEAAKTGGVKNYFVEQRSEEHTSELQSHVNLVCRLLLEKKKSSSTTGGSRTAAPVLPPPWSSPCWLFCLWLRLPPSSTLFPYTTLFRSRAAERARRSPAAFRRPGHDRLGEDLRSRQDRRCEELLRRAEIGRAHV